ncbi:beta(1,3)galactosyltransferase EpsH [Clostridium tertium]|uniref:Glycosyl transferase family 28 C-terminal domain-containing protein n=1 Tax=Clostridium tertium TaxID=1559 RepID=A0A6N2ZQK8_9CLOT
MIFITVGTQRFQFNRLLKAVDKLIEEKKIEEEVFAQIGYSTYKPKHFEFKEFINGEEYNEILEKAEIVITHGGTGTIIKAVKLSKKVIAVPRLKAFLEHVDDHQIQIINEFSEVGFLEKVEDLNSLGEAIFNIRKRKFKEYVSNTSNIILQIEKSIEGDI